MKGNEEYLKNNKNNLLIEIHKQDKLYTYNDINNLGKNLAETIEVPAVGIIINESINSFSKNRLLGLKKAEKKRICCEVERLHGVRDFFDNPSEVVDPLVLSGIQSYATKKIKEENEKFGKNFGFINESTNQFFRILIDKFKK